MIINDNIIYSPRGESPIGRSIIEEVVKFMKNKIFSIGVTFKEEPNDSTRWLYEELMAAQVVDTEEYLFRFEYETYSSLLEYLNFVGFFDSVPPAEVKIYDHEDEVLWEYSLKQFQSMLAVLKNQEELPWISKLYGKGDD